MGGIMNAIMNQNKEIQLLNTKLYMGALKSSSDGILISDNDGNIVYVNEAYEKTSGLKKEDIVGLNLRTLLEQKIINKAVSLSVLETKKRESIIHKYITGKTALTTATPIFDDYGKLIGVVSNTRNIEDLFDIKKELEETKELSRKYSDELNQLRKEQVNIDGLIYFNTKAKLYVGHV